MVLALHVPLFQQHTVMRGSSLRRKTPSFQHPPHTLYIMSPLVSSDHTYSASQGHLFLFFSFYTNCKSARLYRNSMQLSVFFSACRVRWITCGVHEPRESAVHGLRQERPTPSSGKTNRAVFSPMVRRLWSSRTSVLQTGSCGWDTAQPPTPPFSGASYQRETLQRRCRNGQKAQRLPAQQPIYLHVADTITHENIQWCGVIFSTAAFTSSQLSIQSVIHSASVDTLRMYLLSCWHQRFHRNKIKLKA